MNSIQVFDNDMFKVEAKHLDDEVLFNVEDVARALGFTDNSKGTNKVIWNRVNKHLNNSDTSVALVKKGDYITESQVYMLMFKAKNEVAVAFQMWLATEVLPSIRKYGAYIEADAKEEDVDNLLKFSKYRVRKTFANASTEEIEKLYNDFIEFTSKEKAQNRLTAYKSAILGLETFKEINNASTIAVFSATEKLKELATHKNKLDNKINGGLKSYKTKQIKELEQSLEDFKQYHNYCNPSDEDYIEINYPAFSANKMYKPINTRNFFGLVKTHDYKEWIRNFPLDFPIYRLQNDKKYALYMKVDYTELSDADNYIKPFQDRLAEYCGVDDKIFFEVKAIKNKQVKRQRQGKIYYCIREIIE